MTREELDAEIRDRRLRQAKEDVRAQLSTPQGRRFLWRVIDEIAKAQAASAVPGTCESTHETAYREGRRSIGLELLLEAQRLEPSEFVHMLAEATERREKERLAREQADGR